MQGHHELDVAVQYPNPLEFETYLPFACKALQITDVIVTRVMLLEYVSSVGTGKKLKLKGKSRSHVMSSVFNKDESDTQQMFPAFHAVNDQVHIAAYYDFNDNLVQIKFIKNIEIPCTMFKFLSLIIQFYPHLTSISIDRGLSNHGLEELNNFILKSNIIDINLDGSRIYKGNYDVLFENKKVRQVSLCRCNLDDDVVQKIAKNLHYPENSSKSLSVLNLATNKITDKGAKHIATALRSNRRLCYLNLSGNMIFDEGALTILSTLTEFLITFEECLEAKTEYMEYLRKKDWLISKYMGQLKSIDPSTMKKKRGKECFLDKRVKLDEVNSVLKIQDIAKDAKNYILAVTKANQEFGQFSDPFSNKNTVIKDKALYCTGNTKLCYLNLAYNNITLISVRKLLKVLKYQQSTQKNYTGLININIDGNFLPNDCTELTTVNNMLRNNLNSFFEKSKVTPKKSKE